MAQPSVLLSDGALGSSPSAPAKVQVERLGLLFCWRGGRTLTFGSPTARKYSRKLSFQGTSSPFSPYFLRALV